VSVEVWGEPVQQSRKRRKSEQRQRTILVSVRFSPAELEVVEPLAGDRPLSTWLRNLALAQLPCGYSEYRLDYSSPVRDETVEDTTEGAA